MKSNLWCDYPFKKGRKQESVRKTISQRNMQGSQADSVEGRPSTEGGRLLNRIGRETLLIGRKQDCQGKVQEPDSVGEKEEKSRR
jgi:hypothetical protein